VIPRARQTLEPLLASGRVTTLAPVPQRPGPGDSAQPPSTPAGSGRVPVDALLGLCLAACLLAIAFASSGGVDQTNATAGSTWTEILVTLGGAGACAAALVLCRRARAWGAGPVALMTALVAVTALSIIWSVVPDSSWSAANQLVSYLAAFAGAAALARLAPERWRVLLGALAVVAAALSGWALLTKVFPETLAADNVYGRLQAPFGYWNAVGLTGAIGLPPALWAGSRRVAGPWMWALCAPAITLMLSAVVLSYSRSADAVAMVVIAGWIAFVDLRLRSTALLAVSAAGAGAISIWALATSALTSDGPVTAARDSAGHSFGLVVVVVLVVVAAGGLACARAMARVTVSAIARRRIGAALLTVACLVALGAVGRVATSSRGLTGEVSHVWSTLTSTHAAVGDEAGRVLQFGSSRPLYWHQGLDVGEHALLHGVGASGFGTARLHYTTDRYKVDQAHSYLVQTFADLGLIGLAITLGLLAAWLWAAARPVAIRAGWHTLTGEQRRERAGMVALALIVVGFGTQSTLDWTWYFPGVSVPVLLAAGWLAGRGPLRVPVGRAGAGSLLLDRLGAVAAAVAVCAVALAVAWLQWLPLRSADLSSRALSAKTDSQAFADARSAATSDPLAYQPRFVLASLYQSLNDDASARAELVRATQIQPDNPVPWAQLSSFDLQTRRFQDAIADGAHVDALDFTPDANRETATVAITEGSDGLAHAAAIHEAAAEARSKQRRVAGRRRGSKHPAIPATHRLRR